MKRHCLAKRRITMTMLIADYKKNSINYRTGFNYLMQASSTCSFCENVSINIEKHSLFLFKKKHPMIFQQC